MPCFFFFLHTHQLLCTINRSRALASDLTGAIDRPAGQASRYRSSPTIGQDENANGASRVGRTWTLRITHNPANPGTRDYGHPARRTDSSAVRRFRCCSRRAQGRRGYRRPPHRRTCPLCPPSAPCAAILPARFGTRPENKTSRGFSRLYVSAPNKNLCLDKPASSRLKWT